MSDITILDSASDDVLRQHLYPEIDTLDMVTSAKACVAELAVPSTAEDVVNAQLLKADIEALRDAVEAKRVALKAPVLEFGRRLDAIAQAVTLPLAGVLLDLRAKLDEYNRREEAKRREAEEAARQEQEANPDPAYSMPAITPAVIAAATPGVKVKTRTSTEVKIVDASLVPEKFWIIDEAAVKKAALAGEVIPGVEVIKQKKSV
jgi:hypothetical protein